MRCRFAALLDAPSGDDADAAPAAAAPPPPPVAAADTGADADADEEVAAHRKQITAVASSPNAHVL